MDDLLKPSDQMLFTLATELGLMSIVESVDGGETTKDPKQTQAALKVATLT